MKKTNALFLCTGNTARSQMTEALLRKHGSDRFEPFSAGSVPSERNPLTLRVMEDVGLDLEGQRSKSLEEYLGKGHFGHIITVRNEAEERCPTTFPGISQRISWSFENPAAAMGREEQKVQAFRHAQDAIESRIRNWLDEVD
jgi:arsenate reductase